jgi:hypothetical protein
MTSERVIGCVEASLVGGGFWSCWLALLLWYGWRVLYDD